jgi:serine/threonine-protein kinase PknG
MSDQKCQRPGCAGEIVDGVCEDCGRAPAGKSLVAKAAQAAPSGTAGLGAASARSAVSSVGGASGPTGSSMGSGRTGSGRTGRSSARTGRVSTRRQLGAGLVSLPPVVSLDPLQSLMADPVVPDRKRFCNFCGAKLNHERGFCPMCGHEYSFVPTLKPGDIVAGQYEVKGAMAFGGLGWIYLGWDKILSRWVVLKGLLNSKDEASAQAAIAERQFLAAVKNGKIVNIYNFVTQGTEGYIVMEYVGGKTLKSIRQERGPLPPEEAIAYIYAILPAFAYMERMGLVYCDFKPDNFMLEEDDVKLIDMGGVRRVDDLDGDIYGTKGYTAPEADQGPSFVSDLYTVGRTLAVLLLDFKFQGAYLHSLPVPAEQPLFAQQESLYRFLLKATRENPDDRFQTADEMADQLLGVLREIVASHSTPRPSESAHFSGEMASQVQDVDAAVDWASALPTLKVDPLDQAANAILSAGASAGAAKRTLLRSAAEQFPESSEAPLRLAEQLTQSGALDEADAVLDQLQASDPFDWRVFWYRGRLRLAQGKATDAAAAFSQVYAEVPGEVAPKLASALASEIAGSQAAAITLYELVSRTDPSFTSAAFGLARCRAAAGDKAGAVEAFGRVPPSSGLYTSAQMALARCLIQSQPSKPSADDLVRAGDAVAALDLDGFTRHSLAAHVLLAAVAQLDAKFVAPAPDRRILGQQFQAAALRSGAERELRACARYAKTPEERIAFVDQANEIRPRTLF